MKINFRGSNLVTSISKIAIFIAMSLPYISTLFKGTSFYDIFQSFGNIKLFFLLIGICFLIWVIILIRWEYTFDAKGVSIFKWGRFKDHISWSEIKMIDIIPNKVSHIHIRSDCHDDIEFECPLFIKNHKDFIELIIKQLPSENISENFKYYSNGSSGKP